VPAGERAARLSRVADLLGLDGLLARKPSQLSGGQQQRVALGRAIIAEAPVCLMDEPLSNLDAQLRLDMRREIRGLQQKLGVTMVYVTHDQTEAMSMADQVILLREGRVEQDASPAELYARPATAFTARFIGTPPMNILKLANGSGGAVLGSTAGPVLLPGRGDGLLLGVRPEDITLAPSGGLGATVKTIEFLGADSILTCEAGGQSLAVRTPGRVERPTGATVRLAWSKEHVHVFDEQSGRRRDDIPTAGTSG
jgi:sn-glycerol 3-phosphate transport system ATP-binding protein